MPVVYVLVSGFEALLAGSLVGLMFVLFLFYPYVYEGVVVLTTGIVLAGFTKRAISP